MLQQEPRRCHTGGCRQQTGGDPNAQQSSPHSSPGPSSGAEHRGGTKPRRNAASHSPYSEDAPTPCAQHPAHPYRVPSGRCRGVGGQLSHLHAQRPRRVYFSITKITPATHGRPAGQRNRNKPSRNARGFSPTTSSFLSRFVGHGRANLLSSGAAQVLWGGFWGAWPPPGLSLSPDGAGRVPSPGCLGVPRGHGSWRCPHPRELGIGVFGALASLSQQRSAQGRLVGSVPRLCFARAKAPDFLPGLELELQEGHLLVKVISNRNQNLKSFPPGAVLSTTKTPHLNPKPSERSARTSPLAAKSTRFPPNRSPRALPNPSNFLPQQGSELREPLPFPQTPTNPQQSFRGRSRHPSETEPAPSPPSQRPRWGAPHASPSIEHFVRGTEAAPCHAHGAQRRGLPTCSSQLEELLPPEAARASY